MVQIIVVAHGNFASGILSSLKLIAGDLENILPIDFVEGMSARELGSHIASAIPEDDKTLILTDLLGGTPFKVSIEVAQQFSDDEVVVLSGLNLAMLLDASFSRLNYDFETLIEKLVQVEKDGIVDSVSLLNQKEETAALFQDGILKGGIYEAGYC
ncbi:PTS sugar transporter subunit IIA [Streptococcus sp. 121]|uniref:PTS sugar transporter subunit IIA n=1 Tax=Streptococcus sp. 121 TaxID=2797637 RepID=UPI0018F07C14|nr:PTS sugar transporter subunit IIA [Streptococcus sp. 121]MBJ6745349.1 PTS sugar transporter subunit IIA [Streptococcus sp. 121]